MRNVLMLSETEAATIAHEWAKVLPEHIQAHKVPGLWELIGQTEDVFGLEWHEDIRAFKRKAE
jgi:hypothetical protein